MTDHIEDGGPAFAQEQWNPDREMFMVTGGATLRDYFAAHAPPPPGRWRYGERNVKDVVDWAWHYADEMIKARKS